MGSVFLHSIILNSCNFSPCSDKNLEEINSRGGEGEHVSVLKGKAVLSAMCDSLFLGNAYTATMGELGASIDLH